MATSPSPALPVMRRKPGPTALVLLTILALVGMPKLIDNQFTVKKDTQLVSRSVLIGYVEPGSPAAKAGLKAEDQLNDIALSGYSPVGIPSEH